MLIRLEDGELAEADGQLQLDFEAGPAAEAGEAAVRMRLHAGPRTAA